MLDGHAPPPAQLEGPPGERACGSDREREQQAAFTPAPPLPNRPPGAGAESRRDDDAEGDGRCERADQGDGAEQDRDAGELPQRSLAAQEAEALQGKAEAAERRADGSDGGRLVQAAASMRATIRSRSSIMRCSRRVRSSTIQPLTCTV